MGKESREIRKTLKGIGTLPYVEIRNVPMRSFAGYGESVHAQVLSKIEKQVARELIIQRFPVRGLEVEYFRSVLGLSARDFAQKLGLSHVSVLKWEKAKQKPLDLVNEVAVKALVAGLLGLRLPASIESLSSTEGPTRSLVLGYTGNRTTPKRRAA